MLAVVGTLAVFAGIVAVTQISSAEDRRSTASAAGACVAPAPGATAPGGRGTTVSRQNGRDVRNHWGDGQMSVQECRSGGPATTRVVSCPDVAAQLPEIPDRARDEVTRNLNLLQTQIAEADRRLAADGDRGEAFVRAAVLGPLADKRRATLERITLAIGRVAARPEGLDRLAECQVTTSGSSGGDDDGDDDGDNGLDVLADDCDDSRLQPHDGFQNGNRCVSTAFGEVGSAANNPSLLITRFPNQVRVNQAFTLRVATRNLVRDRFLAAGQGGYYLESSLLNDQGLVRGHFHTACRMLGSTRTPPDPAAVPAFFVATEDGGGGAQPDEVSIQVPGLPESGVAQCAVWAGDGSHRLPMMERANQTPAFDVVRIRVGR
ncbi:hypothetical protein O7606_05695 [Micromonospora sp. WMMD882]|uniref:hypothetical protein n=1 Tax=Micromonospora sp. WMMD882 TaxID=3015151 RepID=UPI00248B3C7A|nr:hypothetical protein [Micromonospora sp. WMMD882]WBB80878.1 hypothetical protein O7606_05695 [Micromonospora sp. WMMD882]